MTHPSVEQTVIDILGVGDDVVEVQFVHGAKHIGHDSPLLTVLARELSLLADDAESKYIVFNFSSLKFMSVQVFPSLSNLRDMIQARSGRLILCHLPPELNETLRLSGTRFGEFEIVTTLDEAYELLEQM